MALLLGQWMHVQCRPNCLPATKYQGYFSSGRNTGVSNCRILHHDTMLYTSCQPQNLYFTCLCATVAKEKQQQDISCRYIAQTPFVRLVVDLLHNRSTPNRSMQFAVRFFLDLLCNKSYRCFAMFSVCAGVGVFVCFKINLSKCTQLSCLGVPAWQIVLFFCQANKFIHSFLHIHEISSLRFD